MKSKAMLTLYFKAITDVARQGDAWEESFYSCLEGLEERVCVNKTQHFEPVPLELWEYQIGGYKVLAKWLKDRRDRKLTLEEIKTYCRVVTAIQRTIVVQEEIDAVYPEAERQVVGMVDGT